MYEDHWNRWKDKKVWEVDLLELQTLMDATKYKYSGFNQRCLKPAVFEINLKTDLAVSVEPSEQRDKTILRLKFLIIDKIAQCGK